IFTPARIRRAADEISGPRLAATGRGRAATRGRAANRPEMDREFRSGPRAASAFWTASALFVGVALRRPGRGRVGVLDDVEAGEDLVGAHAEGRGLGLHDRVLLILGVGLEEAGVRLAGPRELHVVAGLLEDAEAADEVLARALGVRAPPAAGGGD